MLKWNQLVEGEGASCCPKGPQTQWAPKGGGQINFDDDEYNDDDDDDVTMILMMTMMNILCFLHPKGPKSWLVSGRATVNYDDNDGNDDDDDDDDNDDDNNYDDHDDDDDVSSKNLFFVGL